MSAFVLDSSVALAWCFKSERTPATEVLLDEATRAGAWVPNLWHLETANVLLGAMRRGRIDAASLHESIALLADLFIHTDELTAARAMEETLALASAHKLTTYDAAYLELAIRRRLPLATLDAALQRAAQACGIPLAVQPT
jgi:predicted nucleic acid-binding protein